jgi:methylated-DNA-[protein]-cysteine S-methyltransferase
MSERRWRQESPIGTLTVHASELGVHRIEFGDHPIDGAEARDAAVAGELDEYFTGGRREFTVAVDLSDYAPHPGVDVLQTLRREVGWGETVTYGELAEMAGRPRAARFVGNVMARNPIPILIPCHRVVAAGGRLGGYGATGTDTKRWLLEREGVIDLR